MAFCSALRGPALACWSSWEWEGAQYQLSLSNVSKFTLDTLSILPLVPGTQLFALSPPWELPSPDREHTEELTLGNPSVY